LPIPFVPGALVSVLCSQILPTKAGERDEGTIAKSAFIGGLPAADFGANPASLGRAPMSLGYNVRAKPEVDQLMEPAVAAGAKILKPAQVTSWGGYSGYFADPDDFAWEIASNPSWPISPDGSVHFN
jgi:uncharacterized glyoxalase superfamily protein PhnB